MFLRVFGYSESLDWTRLYKGNKNGGARPHGMPLGTPKASGALNLSGPPETAAISLSLVYFLKCQCLLTHSAYWLRAFLRLYWIFPDFPFESKLKTSSQLEWKRLQRKITELCTWLFWFQERKPCSCHSWWWQIFVSNFLLGICDMTLFSCP